MTRTLALAALLAARAFAQTAAPPAFDAASIKLSKAENDGEHWHTRTGSIDMRNLTLRSLIRAAYQVRDYQISGGPGWATSDRFDIVARSSGPADDPELMKMLQTLLADRFQLVFHKEARQFPGYALTVAKKGLKITPVEDNGGHNSKSNRVHLEATRISMPRFAEWLSVRLGSPVEDRTETAGVFTFELNWTPEPSARPGEKQEAEFREAGPSIYTAIQDQLGLHLESHKIAADVMVIDRAEKPSEN
jgi:uncharacterized protein (TIGR03435 family)